jgi:hypothetical protein
VVGYLIVPQAASSLSPHHETVCDAGISFYGVAINELATIWLLQLSNAII